MPLKLSIASSRKVGEPNYGSRGATVGLEMEVDFEPRGPSTATARAHSTVVSSGASSRSTWNLDSPAAGRADMLIRTRYIDLRRTDRFERFKRSPDDEISILRKSCEAIWRRASRGFVARRGQPTDRCDQVVDQWCDEFHVNSFE